MTANKQMPNYLKLHIEMPGDVAVASTATRTIVDSLSETFQQVTGWPLRLESERTRDELRSSVTESRANLAPAANRLTIDLQSSRPCHGAPLVDLPTAQKHVAALNELVDELDRTRHALWQREAELAVSVPVVEHADEEAHLAFRLDSVLKSGADAVGCQAAALYLLDDATSQLKLRAAWNLPEDRFYQPARPLRGAVADLEALLGHAVVLKDTSILPHWKAPEEFPAAVCVPVATPTTLLGTLWVFADELADFDENKTNLLEIVAGRLAADLEREVLMQQSVQSKRVDLQLSQAATRQRDRLPSIAPLLDGWQVAGWTMQADSLSGDFYDWSILPDSRLMVAVGSAEGALIEAGLTATTLQSAIKSHGFYRHDPRQMMDRLNETLWTASTGDQFASLFYSQIDPDSGDVEYSIAGNGGGLILRRGKCETISHESPLLGADPDASFKLKRGKLRHGELLLVFSQGVRAALRKIDSASAEEAIATALGDIRDRGAEEIVERIRDLVDTYGPTRADADRTVLVVRRA